MNTTKNRLAELASENCVTRERARKALVAEGGNDVVDALAQELSGTTRQRRWEAVVALSGIASPLCALSLVRAMDDEDTDIAWIAAEGIAKLGEAGFIAVLSRLTHHSSIRFCRLAHHSLKVLRGAAKHPAEVKHVMTALKSLEPTLAAPVAAYEALQSLRNTSAAVALCT